MFLTQNRAADTFSLTVSTPSGRIASSPLRWRIIVALVGLAILVAAGWLALIVVSRIDDLFFPGESIGDIAPIPGVDDGGDSGPINLLVLGLDRRPAEGDIITRTDTIFVVTIDPQTKTAGILGIPRDSWVDIPLPDGGGIYQERINTVFAAGEQGGYSGGGKELAKDVVEENLGINIDHYVLIDFEGFIEVIDALGGIEIYVEEEIDDPTYSRTELPGDYYPLHFDVGDQHMDGQTALDYSRTRTGNSDLDRIRRQQQVIFAAIDTALQRDLVSPDKLFDLWKDYKGAIETDINDIQAPGFARLASQVDPADIAALSIGAATTPFTGPAGQAVLLIDKDIVQEIVAALFATDRRLTEEAALVEVQDGADASGLAGDVVLYLQQFGFGSDSLSASDTVDGTVPPLTTIIDFSGRTYTTERLAALLNVSSDQVREASDEDQALRTVADADVVVILGADAQARDYSVEPAAGG